MTTLQEFGQVFARLEDEIGLPRDWCTSLVKEEDWSFVIKLQALIEAALTHLLVAELDRPQLQRFVESMNMGGQFGKLELALGLGVLDAAHVKFIRALATMRNACVHDVRNVTFECDAYSRRLPEDRRAELVNAVQGLIYTPRTPQEVATMKEITGHSLKLVMFLAGLNLLVQFYKRKELAAALARQNRRAISGERVSASEFAMRLLSPGRPGRKRVPRQSLKRRRRIRGGIVST